MVAVGGGEGAVPSPELAGRERELGSLEGWLGAALGGSARLVLCSGEPGVGKTRLAQELIALASARDVPSLWGRATEVPGAPPYWPWMQVVGAAVGTAAGHRSAAEPGMAADLAVLAPDLLPAVTARESADGAGTMIRFRLFDSAARFLRQVSEEHGLVIVLDDVHLADQPSLLLLQHLACRLTGSRLLIFGQLALVVGRPVTGLQIVAVWESKAHHDRFVTERLHPRPTRR